MGKALYRTYRSKKLSEIVGQEHITVALTNALKSGAISHAYLFTGPRGVGKTSIARILAHEINGLPYDDDSTHLDIIEIDAASNRRIDEIRDLRDKVHIAPTSAKYKVYIIDEVHMLTREAFNALLKTLEEPPAHAVFILATTEAHKLPETIVSRTQRFAFKPVDLGKVAGHLKMIAKQEKIAIDDEALKMIAAHGEGSFRDSISLLDQARSIGHKVTAADVEALLGMAPTELITALLQFVAAHDAAHTVQTLAQLYNQGSDPARIAKQLSAQLREQLLGEQASLPREQLVTLLTKLLEVASAGDAHALLEITLLDIALSGTPQLVQAPVQLIPPAKPQPAVPKPIARTASANTGPVTPVLPPTNSDSAKLPLASASQSQVGSRNTPVAGGTGGGAPGTRNVSEHDGEASASDRTRIAGGSKKADAAGAEGSVLDQSQWDQVLSAVKANHNTLYSILRAAEPQFGTSTVKLIVSNTFNKKILTKSENKEVISKAISAAAGVDIAFECEVGKPRAVAPSIPDGEVSHAVSTPSVSEPPQDEQDYYTQQADQEAAKRPITTVSNIFGGGELLQS
jgi:DNA polymerase-3 subunit gamma/tau